MEELLIGKCMNVQATAPGKEFNIFDDSLSSLQDASNMLLHEGMCFAKFDIRSQQQINLSPSNI